MSYIMIELRDLNLEAIPLKCYHLLYNELSLLSAHFVTGRNETTARPALNEKTYGLLHGPNIETGQKAQITMKD